MPVNAREARLIFAEEFRRSTRRLAYVVITLSVPALLLLLMGIIPLVRALTEREEGRPTEPIGLVSLAPDLPVGLGTVPGVVAVDSREGGVAALARGDISELFIIPRDYLETGRVEWLHPPGGLLSGFGPGPEGASDSTVRAVLRIALAGSALPPEVLARALAPAVFERVQLGSDGTPREEDAGAEVARFFLAFLGAVLLVFSILMAGSSLVQAVSEEKENRMIEVLLTSARPLSLMVGKVLAIGAAGLLQMAVWVTAALVILPRVFDALPRVQDVPIDPLVLMWLLAFFLAGYMLNGAVMAGVGAGTTRVREATQIAGIMVIPLVAPIYGLALIISAPQGALARTLSFIPFTAPTAMMVRLAVGEPSVVEILGSLGITLLAAAGLLWASARVFRAGLLMYGQRMGFRPLLRALRGAS